MGRYNDCGNQGNELNLTASEILMAQMFREDLGVEINSQALRIFIRTRWERLSPLAHRIQDGKK